MSEPTSPNGPLLACENLEVFYGKYLQVLRGVSVEVGSADTVAVLGPNGAGKTTLVRTVMGLLDDQPERGRVVFAGERIDRWDTGKRVEKGIACVPEGREIFDELTVRENLLMGAWVEGRGLEERLARVYQRFPVLAERRAQLAGTMSGGEQQMLAIGRALMSRPRMLVLDEPSLGLAPRMVEQIFGILAELAAQGIAILVIEQNARVALSFARRGYVLEGGRIVMSGSAVELRADPNVQEFYLGMKAVTEEKGYRRYKRRRRWA